MGIKPDSGLGFEVLADILNGGHFFETLDANNPGMVAEYNFAKAILGKCVKSVDVISVVQAFVGLRRI